MHIFHPSRLALKCTLVIALVSIFLPLAHSQALPTQTLRIQLQAFALGDYTWTQFNGGRNTGITPGANLIFRPFFGISPSVEVRATFPINSGTQLGLESGLGGLGLTTHFRRYHPYLNALVGIGKPKFVNTFNGYSNTNLLIYQFDLGTDINTPFPGFAIRAEAATQHWNIANSYNNGIFTPITVSLGLRYRFGTRRY